MAAPAPQAGAALITALNILEGYNITSQIPRNSTHHWIAEVLQLRHPMTTLFKNKCMSIYFELLAGVGSH